MGISVSYNKPAKSKIWRAFNQNLSSAESGTTGNTYAHTLGAVPIEVLVTKLDGSRVDVDIDLANTDASILALRSGVNVSNVNITAFAL